MFTKSFLNKIFLSVIGLIFLLPNSGYALDTPVTINGKCVSRIITFTASKAKPDNGVLVTPSNGYVNIYVLNGSDFSYSVQDVSGVLAKSPSQAFYYDYRASTIIPGNYAGYDFAGNTNYMSMGTAALFFGSDTSYTCNGGAGTVLGGTSLLKSYSVSVSVSTPGINAGVTPTGTGFYKEGSQVTVSVPNVSGYVFDKWTGSCNYQSLVLNNYATKLTYTYTISNLIGNCALVANYVKQEEVFTTLFHTIKLGTTGGGYVTLSGSNSASTVNSVVSQSVRNGDTVTYSSTASSGYVFSGWSGDLLGSGSSGSILSDRDKFAQAQFTAVGLTNSTTTCIDVPGSISVTTYPKGAGALKMYYPTVITSSTDLNLTSTYLGPSGSGSNGNSCANGFLIEPLAWSGYVFSGWSGDSNVATGTILNLNTYNRLYKGDWITGSKTITANFTYTGEENDNGNAPDSVDEPVYVAQNDSVAKLFEFTQGTVSRSPFSIDNKCVNRVMQFNGTRVVSLGVFGLNFNISFPHIYTIYSLEGSALTQNQDGSLITFKSAPSNFVYSYDKLALSSGNYQSSNQSYFTGSADSLTFKNFTDIRYQAYSCVFGTDKYSVEPLVFTPDSLMLSLQGFSYAITTDSQLYNVATGTVNGLISHYRGINNFKPQVLNASVYTAVDCTLAHNTFGSIDLGCPAWISDSYNYYLDRYRYMWVFSTKPVKNYLHSEENEIGGCSGTGFFDTCNASTSVRQLYAYDPDISGMVATGTLQNPFYDTADNQVGIYATRIDLSLCHKYFGTGAYRNKVWAFVSEISGNSSECKKLQRPRYLNDFVFESSEETNTVYIFGVLMTSIGTDYSQWSSDRISVDILGSPIITDFASSTLPGNSEDPTVGRGVTPEDIDILPPYSSDTYSADTNTTLPGKPGYVKGYNSVISDVTVDINSRYDINKCFEYGYTSGLLKGLGCILSNGFMTLITTLFIPSTNDIRELQTYINGQNATTSIVTAFLTIPTRFSKYADLNWYPNWTYSNYASSTFVYTPGYNVYTATTTIASYYVATTTTPGYYDAPVYHATSTGLVTATTTFTTNGTFVSPTSQNIKVLMLGGGGGGGQGASASSHGGGGSSAQYLYNSSFSVASSTYSIVIGAGGSPNNSGGNTTFSTLTALGGSKGGSASAGTNGFNGGGGSDSSYSGGTASSTGYVGGNGCGVNCAGGGGGGSASAGSNGNGGTYLGGAGGTGISNSITGTATYYGAGGEGSSFYCSTGAGRASGIGGLGGGSSCSGSSAIGYGSGGGGGNNAGAGSGSNGVVIIASLVSTVINGYYDAPVYHATTTNNGYWTSPTDLPGYFTYVATSTTNGTFVKTFSTGTGTMPYLSVGFSSSTKVYLTPATAGDYTSSKFATADKMLFDYLYPFISFIFTLFISWKVYKLILL